MEKKSSELIQTIIFTIIASAQVFLASRYYSREDVVGTVVFFIVAVLAGIAAFGHFLAWRQIRQVQASN
jgi:Zn-dependent protease with chaperone function